MVAVEGAQRWRSMILKERPLVVIIGFSCTHWTSFCNMNYSHRLDELESLRRVDRRMLRLMIWTMIEQSSHNRFFLFENPPRSAIWSEDAMRQVYALPNTMQGVGDACMFGKRIPKGQTGEGLHVFKQYRWLSNSSALLKATCRHCNHTHVHYQSERGEHIHGSLTKWSGEYTSQLARAILRAVATLSRM